MRRVAGSECARRYYELDVEVFKSSVDAHILDALWSEFWATTLASSPLARVRAASSGTGSCAHCGRAALAHSQNADFLHRQVLDISARANKLCTGLMYDVRGVIASSGKTSKEAAALDKIAADRCAACVVAHCCPRCCAGADAHARAARAARPAVSSSRPSRCTAPWPSS